jgi:hypothetical protein
MERNSYEWLAPLTGVAFVILAFIGFAVSGDPVNAKHSGTEIATWYTDHKNSVQIGAILAGVAASLFLFYAGYLRKVLKAAEGEGGALSLMVVAGVAVFAVGLGIDQALAFAIAERADDIDPVGVQALQAFWDNDFLPIAIGLQVFLFATGISIVRHGAFPKWMGWLLIVFGITTVTPVFFVGFLGGALFVLISSVMMASRARKA